MGVFRRWKSFNKRKTTFKNEKPIFFLNYICLIFQTFGLMEKMEIHPLAEKLKPVSGKIENPFAVVTSQVMKCGSIE